MVTIQRESSCALRSFVKRNGLFAAMLDDIRSGNILPCLRKGEIHFYGWGARLFNFSPRAVKTHVRYLGEDGNNERALRSDEQTCKNFKEIRERAKNHRQVVVDDSSENLRNAKEIELAQVAKIFSDLSITRAEARHNDLVLIDVEARFGKIAERNLPNKMIDLVFLMPNRELLFVEAKGVWNKGVQSQGRASVEDQVAIYEQHIKQNGVLEAFNVSIQTQSALMGNEKPLATAIGIFPRVPILVLDPRDPKRPIGPRNSWLRDRLDEAASWTIGLERPLVIDGRHNPTAALQSFVERFGTS